MQEKFDKYCIIKSLLRSVVIMHKLKKCSLDDEKFFRVINDNTVFFRKHLQWLIITTAVVGLNSKKNIRTPYVENVFFWSWPPGFQINQTKNPSSWNCQYLFHSFIYQTPGIPCCFFFIKLWLFPQIFPQVFLQIILLEFFFLAKPISKH